MPYSPLSDRRGRILLSEKRPERLLPAAPAFCAAYPLAAFIYNGRLLPGRPRFYPPAIFHRGIKYAFKIRNK